MYIRRTSRRKVTLFSEKISKISVSENRVRSNRLKINQYHVTPFESDERLSYFRSLSNDDLTAIWKL